MEVASDRQAGALQNRPDDVAGRARDDDVVVFKSLGVAAEDLAVAKLVLDRARERGLGTEV